VEVVEYSHSNPAVNVALEEVILESVRRGLRGPTARIWINPPSIVIGYTLRPCEEVDCPEAVRLGLPILRRVSGGGAVYHDYGNINVTVVKPSGAYKMLDEVYREITGLVLRILERLGVKGWVENLNDVVVRGYKVSGSAAALRPGGYLVHATLLVASNIEVLRRVIKPRMDRVARGEVTPAKYNPANLRDVCAMNITLGDVLEATRGALEDTYGPLTGSRVTRAELEHAVVLSKSKVLVSPQQL
jgi:lipoate-protein ligase A